MVKEHAGAIHLVFPDEFQSEAIRARLWERNRDKHFTSIGIVHELPITDVERSQEILHIEILEMFHIDYFFAAWPVEHLWIPWIESGAEEDIHSIFTDIYHWG